MIISTNYEENRSNLIGVKLICHFPIIVGLGWVGCETNFKSTRWKIRRIVSRVVGTLAFVLFLSALPLPVLHLPLPPQPAPLLNGDHDDGDMAFSSSFFFLNKSYV